MSMNRLVPPTARLLGSLLAVLLILGGGSALVPLHMREEPVQLVTVPSGQVLWVPDPAHTLPFIPDSEASCPGLVLLVLLVIGLVLTAAENRRSLPEAIDAAAVYLLAQALSGGLTLTAKNYCGYFRPNYFEGCGWNATAHACTRAYIEGRHSFPSGHSSSSATGATVLSLYLLRRLAQQPRVAQSWLRRAAARLLVPAPGAVAVWVAATRVHDNWHSPADVCAGSALGAVSGALVFKLAVEPASSRPASTLIAGTAPRSDDALGDAHARAAVALEEL